MAPSRDKLLNWFIEDLSDQTLEKVRNHPGTVIEDGNFHLDVQGKTTNGQLNLQIQVDAHPRKTSLREWATQTVSGPAFLAVDEAMSPEEVREAFKNSIVDFNDKSQQRGKGTRVKKPKQNAEEKTEEPDQGGDKEKQNKKEKGKNKFGKW